MLYMCVHLHSDATYTKKLSVDAQSDRPLPWLVTRWCTRDKQGGFVYYIIYKAYKYSYIGLCTDPQHLTTSTHLHVQVLQRSCDRDVAHSCELTTLRSTARSHPTLFTTEGSAICVEESTNGFAAATSLTTAIALLTSRSSPVPFQVVRHMQGRGV